MTFIYVLVCGKFVNVLTAAANVNEQMHAHVQTQPAAALLL